MSPHQHSPFYYVQKACLANSIDAPIEEIYPIIEQGLEREPLNRLLYEEGVKRNLPKWGGRKEALETYANFVVQKTHHKIGMTAYLMIYWIAFELEFKDRLFSDTDVVWQKMRQGMDDLLSAHPSQWNVNSAAYFACLAGKKGDARKYMGMIDTVDLRRWNSKSNYESFKMWTEKMDAAKP